MNVRSRLTDDAAPRGERPTHILESTLELISEEGLTGFSIGKLAKRAEASPGVIYHYFESKDVLIHTLYREVLATLVRALTHNIATRAPTERLKSLWRNAFDFHVHHPRETTFLEQYKNSAYYPQRLAEADAPLEHLVQTFQEDIARGTFKDLPLPALQAMTFEVAISLAKLQVSGVLEFDEATLDTIADTVCHTVLR